MSLAKELKNTMQKYNSAPETVEHMQNVQKYIAKITSELIHRGMDHDASKLQPPEKEAFDKSTPKLKGLTYGSSEYKQSLLDIKPAIDHHNSVNRHHPEHFENGFSGMNLIDIIEMLCDWKAATLRHADGDILKSLEINKGRFQMSEQLYIILKNTIIDLGWDK